MDSAVIAHLRRMMSLRLPVLRRLPPLDRLQSGVDMQLAVAVSLRNGHPDEVATPVGGGTEKALVHVEPPFVDRKTAALPFAFHELLNPVITIPLGFAGLMARLGSLSEYVSTSLRFRSVFETTVSTST